MATAYAALVSIMQIIDELQRHPRPPISLDKQQVQSLTEVVTSLQQFLEAGYNKNASYSDEADPLEMRIADAAHAVEDVIESHIVDRILADREDISPVDLYRAVQRVIDEMELVKKEAMDVMKEKMRSGHELPTADADSSTSAAASSSLDWPEQNTTMVGFDDILIQVLDKLTSHGSRRRVISITEGFVKPISGKTLEETAKEYIIELVERNLILINKTDRSDWMYKECTMHDLLRDLCLRESHKQNFVYVVGERSLDNIPHSIDFIRHIVVAKNTPEAEVLPLLESASQLRTLFWGESSEGEASLLSICSRLLRVVTTHNVEDVLQKVNLRVVIDMSHDYRNISSISLFWNLQTLYIDHKSSHLIMAPYEIWMMSQLRIFDSETPLSQPDSPSCQMDCNIVLENLHTLTKVYNFKCSEEVVKRIPRIKFLVIRYAEVEGSYDVDYCLNNLGCLQKLEILDIEVQTVNSAILVQNQNRNIIFPSSLLMLDLLGTTLHWDDVTTKIGSLPLLQSLALRRDSCIGAKWETIEGQFCSLRALRINECGDMEYWITENTHFPRLELLQLGGLHKLKEIPLSIGDIPTLQSIHVEDCCDSVNYSAQRIKEEQEELGNEDLQVLVAEDKYNSEEESSLEHETENED